MSPFTARTQLRLRLILSILLGAGVGIGIAPLVGVAAAILAGWGVLSLVSVTWIVLVVWPMNAAQTRAHAIAEDPGRQVARIIALVGSVVSLAAVLIVVIEARSLSGAAQYVLAGIAVASVAASWALIQVDYLLRYAKIYYEEPKGGIEFNQDEDPEYTDFAYFSIGLGMTYQVADTNVTTNGIRRIVIAQTMLAYLFGAVILGTIINLITGLS